MGLVDDSGIGLVLLLLLFWGGGGLCIGETVCHAEEMTEKNDVFVTVYLAIDRWHYVLIIVEGLHTAHHFTNDDVVSLMKENWSS